MVWDTEFIILKNRDSIRIYQMCIRIGFAVQSAILRPLRIFGASKLIEKKFMPEPQPYPLRDLHPGNCDFQELSGNQVNLAKEDMSLAFIYGLVAHAGLQTEPQPLRHDDGIDIQIGASAAVVNGVKRRNPRVLLQVKATSHPEFNGNNIVFRFKNREKYNELNAPSTFPQGLMVYVMPDNRQNWMMTLPSHTDIVGHGFIFDMAHAPVLSVDDTPKIVIPLANRLTTRSFLAFFEDAVRNFYP